MSQKKRAKKANEIKKELDDMLSNVDQGLDVVYELIDDSEAFEKLDGKTQDSLQFIALKLRLFEVVTKKLILNVSTAK